MNNTTSNRISVVCPLYNGAGTCEEAMLSIVTQTQQPYEVILVDDGSTDQSLEIAIQALERNGIPCKPITQTNAGQAAARNRGIEASEGNYIAFLDQDDYWKPGHLELLSHTLANRTDIAWVYTDFDEIDEDGALVTRAYLAHHGQWRQKNALHHLINYDLMVLPSASVIRRDALLEVGGFDEQFRGYEDDDLFIRLFRRGWQSVGIPEATICYRIHSNSTSAGEHFRRSRLLFIDKLRETLADYPRLNRYYLKDIVYPRFFQCTLREYSTALRSGCDDEARDIAVIVRAISDRFGGNSLKRLIELHLLNRPKFLRFLLRFSAMLPRRLRPSWNPDLKC